jgi:hypothetical protein
MKLIASVAILTILTSLVLYLMKKKPKQIVSEGVVIEPPVKKKRVYKKKTKKV